ncbi:hypothetical protein [Mucilaginibacter jinjuensis]|uniref:Uncharacterized protein n=1 Tax=Mucilaginibacter jinjuensis TaxID=1176721 RepID=A0ABY7TFQ2_9SPHI|nr:hypothetical protein [Mucilaginibacter jinjuensis]WCT14442.1 hypothetical protein PQO05_10910 [Mucilaginibacter jinjuensis]
MINKVYDSLSQQIKKEALTVFCGSGISFNSGFPVANQLVKKLFDEAGLNEKNPFFKLNFIPEYLVIFSRIPAYNDTVEELENSKAKLIESVKIQLTANYQKEIDNLNEKLKANEELRLQTAKDLEQVYKEKMELPNVQLTSERKLQTERIGIMNDQINNYRSAFRIAW